MLNKLYPDTYLDSIDDIDFEMYYKKGIRGIVSDIDNTLVPHGAPADEHIIKVFEKIHGMGIDTCLISNNRKLRVEPFAKAVNSKFIYDAHKPSRESYKKAMELMNTDKESTLFIGDQIFTDIFGGNRAGLDTVLTEPIDKSTDEPQIVVKRWFEKPFRKVRRDF